MGRAMTRKPPLNIHGEPRAFFGRKAGKRLHGRQQMLYDTVLPELAIELPEAGPLDPRALFARRPERIVIEIGYGGGEHLARQMAESPGTGFIGCEVFTGGIGKLLERIDTGGHDNIRLYDEDALQLLFKLPDAAIARIDLLYPDPWPKTRHHKRRFVSPLTLAEMARVLEPGGALRFVTDIEDYANWTLAHVLREGSFAWPVQRPGAWHTPYEGWEPTRYETKARREGRAKSFYFTFIRH